MAFLFTDVQGSTARWERHRSGMAAAVEHHLALLREAVESHGGIPFKVVGDAVQAAFPAAPQAVAAALGRAVGDRQALAGSPADVAGVALERGDPEQAASPAAEALALAREMTDRWTLGGCLARAADVAEAQGEPAAVARLHAEGLGVAMALDERGAAYHLDGIGRAAIARGETERGARLLGAAEAVRVAHAAHESWWRNTPAEAARHDRAVARARAALGDAGVAAATEAGRALEISDAGAEGRALAGRLDDGSPGRDKPRSGSSDPQLPEPHRPTD